METLLDRNDQVDLNLQRQHDDLLGPQMPIISLNQRPQDPTLNQRQHEAAPQVSARS